MRKFLFDTPGTAALLLVLLLVCTMLTSKLFFNPFHTGLFSYLIIAGLFVVIAGITLWKASAIKISRYAAISAGVAIVWIAYICVHNRAHLNENGLKPYFLITNLLLFIVAVVALGNARLHTSLLVKVMCLIGCFECTWCLLQFVGLLHSANPSFRVTGTWVNPNITAMFLAVLFPFVFANMLVRKGPMQRLYAAAVFLFVIVILLLKCRTAFIGTAAGTLVIVEWRYRLLKNFFKSSGRAIIAINVTMLFVIVAGLGYTAYHFKKASADGRILIWKLSADMISRKPVTGFGYGSFERNYNLRQAEHFSGTSFSEQQVWNASHTDMAYNEIMENAIEGGLIGAALFIAFFGISLVRGYRTFSYFAKPPPAGDPKAGIDRQIGLICAHTGLGIILLMSLMNFTITSLPLMGAFVIFSIISARHTTSPEKFISLPSLAPRFIVVILLLAGILVLFKTSKSIYAQRMISKAVGLAKDNDHENALSLLESIPVNERYTENYHYTLGNVLYLKKDVQSALAAYRSASLSISTPELYQQMGHCFLSAGNFEMAIRHYRIAGAIQPNRFTPKVFLLKTYMLNKDKANALKTANEIVLMEEKYPSEETKKYKTIAQNVLNRFQKTNKKI